MQEILQIFFTLAYNHIYYHISLKVFYLKKKKIVNGTTSLIT